MADRIITVTNPSVVTNDTLSGYNNYSDQDGQLGTTMTPTEATNGHTVALSDGVVHEVTTKPVGATNGEFTAVVSNAVTVDLSGGALYDNDFTSTLGRLSMPAAAGRELTLISDAARMTEVTAGTTLLVYLDLSALGFVNDETVQILIDWKSVSVASAGVAMIPYYPTTATLLTGEPQITNSTPMPTTNTEYTFTYIDAQNQFILSAGSANFQDGEYFEMDRIQINNLG